MNPSLAYAENELGVHSVYEEAGHFENTLQSLLSDMTMAIGKRRDIDEAIESRQMDILIVERGKASEISQAAMDRRLREAYHRDAALVSLRKERGRVAGELTNLEHEIEATKARLKSRVARMEELGGYLNYLAALKNASRTCAAYAEAGNRGDSPTTASGETKEDQSTGVTA